MHARIRWKKLFAWSVVLLLATVSGVVGFTYWWVTKSDTLAEIIRTEGPRFLPGSRVDLARARIRLMVGEIKLHDVYVRQMIDKVPFLTLRIPWLQIRHNPKAMLKRQFIPLEVVVAQPTLRLCRRKDGTWNIQGLLANPWPGPPMKGTPPVLIQNGTVELCDGDDPHSVAILREVAIRIEGSTEGSQLSFEGSAKGDVFDRFNLRGTVDCKSGRISLAGDIARLAISETLRKRLPVEFRPTSDKVGLLGGEVDCRIARLSFDPAAHPPLRYDVTAQIRSGVWNCPKMPFPINDLSAVVKACDGVVTVERGEGFNGPTTVRVEKSRIVLGDPATTPLDVSLAVIDLELDKRLHDWTPPQFAGLWNEFRPQGRVSAAVHLVRDQPGAPVGYGWTVDCRDVSMIYRFFKYPVDHVRGLLSYENGRITLGLQTLLGGKPLTASGTIDSPGPNAKVRLDFKGDALPIDKTLFDALPPDIRTVVDQFQPNGTVRGEAHVERTPRMLPTDPPEGKIAIDATLDLNERCSIKWAGLPYPVSNLTGRLELHPDKWKFSSIRGTNGQAEITANGEVEALPGPGKPLRVDLHLFAKKLPFDDQLRDALPTAWRKTWATLNPVGASNVEALIKVRPGKPDQYHLEIDPKPDTSVRLSFSRAPKVGVDPGGTFDLRMENVRGRFVFDNGPVEMIDVGFQFQGTPVQFTRGRVVVEDSGRFQLGVNQIWARNFRLDQTLRKIMPPVMAEFARKLDDGRAFSTIKGNLGLSWSGQPGAPVRCDWSDVLVVFNDNTIKTGLPLEHLQGQIDHVRGFSDGEKLDVQGALRLESVSLLGQQVTGLESPFRVANGLAEISDIRGQLLGGTVMGQFNVTLAETPRYHAKLAVDGADLRRYAETLAGRQSFRGVVFGNLEVDGLGSELRTLQGQGELHVVQGNLGELPIMLRLVKTLTLSSGSKNALFDSADVALRIQDGESVFDPIRLTGDTFSLLGKGTLGIQGDLDLRLKPLYGRDRMHVPILSDAMREASGQLFVIRVLGPLTYPRFRPEPLPGFSDGVRTSLSRRREGTSARLPQ